MRRLFLGLLLAVGLLLPTTATATPIASVLSPVDGACIGGTHRVEGEAKDDADGVDDWDDPAPNGNGTSYWDLTLKRADNGQVFQTWHFQSQRSGIGANNQLTHFDTTVLPQNVALRFELFVHALDGDASAGRTFTPVYDRQNPTAPSVTTVYAASSRMVWLGWTNSTDSGCSGGVRDYYSYAVERGLLSFGTLQTDVNQVINGSDHEAISQPVLDGGQAYKLRAVATDRVGLESGSQNEYSFTTPGTYATVLAGQVKGTKNGQFQLISGLQVTARRVSDGQVVDQTITDAGGWYRLNLEHGRDYAVQYGPGCTFLPAPWCATGWVPSVDAVTTPTNQIGIIVRHHKVMQPGN